MKGAHFKANNVWPALGDHRAGRVIRGDLTYYFDEHGQELGYTNTIGLMPVVNTSTKGRQWGWDHMKTLEITDISPNAARVVVHPEELYQLHRGES